MPKKKKRAIRAERERRQGSRDLNLDVLLVIFNYLDKANQLRCAQVCKHWRTAVYHPSLWTNYLFCVMEDGLNAETATSLKERDIKTVSLRLNKFRQNEPSGSPHHQSTLKTLASCANVAEIQTLLLLGRPSPAPPECTMNEIVLCPKFPSSFETLHSLLIYNVDLLEASLQAALGALSNLHTLHMKWQYPVPAYHGPRFRYESKEYSFDFLSIILKELPSLKDLEIQSCAYSGWGKEGFSISDDIAVLPNLERLAIYDQFNDMIRPQHLRDILQKFPSLKHIDLWLNTEHLSGNSQQQLQLPTVNSVQSLCQNGQNIRDPIEHCYVLFRAIFPNLSALDLSFCGVCHKPFDEETVSLLTEHAPNLEVLRLEGYTMMTDEQIQQMLFQMSQLKVLIIKLTVAVWEGNPFKEGLIISSDSQLRSLLLIARGHTTFTPDLFFGLERVKYLWWNNECKVKQRVHNPNSQEDEWKVVPSGSEGWKEATGWNYFHLPDSFCAESHMQYSGLPSTEYNLLNDLR